MGRKGAKGQKQNAAHSIPQEPEDSVKAEPEIPVPDTQPQMEVPAAPEALDHSVNEPQNECEDPRNLSGTQAPDTPRQASTTAADGECDTPIRPPGENKQQKGTPEGSVSGGVSTVEEVALLPSLESSMEGFEVPPNSFATNTTSPQPEASNEECYWPKTPDLPVKQPTSSIIRFASEVFFQAVVTALIILFDILARVRATRLFGLVERNAARVGITEERAVHAAKTVDRIVLHEMLPRLAKAVGIPAAWGTFVRTFVDDVCRAAAHSHSG